MGEFEENIIYPYIEGRTKLYLRYIEDIFIIWTGNKHSNLPNSFLNLMINMTLPNLTLKCLKSKQTGRQNYLHMASEHPEPLKLALPTAKPYELSEFALRTQNTKITPSS